MQVPSTSHEYDKPNHTSHRQGCKRDTNTKICRLFFGTESCQLKQWDKNVVVRRRKGSYHVVSWDNDVLVAEDSPCNLSLFLSLEWVVNLKLAIETHIT
ncbi:hypothetical protein J6590_013861 [Homalodisca vitripennis]|nr:hypothetical protein J6590_013861 [Homalodisca vitripennis]